MRVVINDSTSTASQVYCEVPQESVLGPLLFLVYVDMLRFYLPGVVLTTFADDTAKTIAEPKLLDLVVCANRVLQYLNVFTSLSSLSVNYMIFSRTGVVINSLKSITLVMQ